MNNRPTICQVLHSLTLGGAEVLAADLARRLAAQYRFVFACLDEPGSQAEQLRAEGFPVEVIQRRPGTDWGCMRGLARWWRREDVCLVHAHQYTPFFYSLAARGWHARPPILFTEHGRFFPDYPRRKRMLFNRIMLRRTDRVVAVGEAVRRALVENEGIPTARIHTIYNGVSMAALCDGPADRLAVRAELGLHPNDWTVLQVARLDPIKDHATAIRAIGHVAGQCGRVRLLLVGDGPERGRIEAEIARQGLGSHVRLLGTRRDVPHLLPAADAFLLTSVSEGIPVTILEAMSAGVPVVATDVGGVAEIVVPGQTGLLAPAGDHAALAAALLRLLDDPPLCERMARLGRSRVEDLFTQERMHAAYRRTYEEMLHG